MDKRRYMLDEWIKILKGKWKGDYTHLAIYDYGKAANWRYDECPCLPEQCFSKVEFDARLAEIEKENEAKMNESTLVPRKEWESDLDWLARNVHEWREGANYICVDHTDGGYVFHEHNRNCAVWFTRDQWLSRRAELQNKPSWKDAPEWANWLCQRDDGKWFWCIEEPRVSESGWETRHESRAAYPSGDQIPEHVLGDWRDTIEKRPEQTIADICEGVTSENRREEIFEPFVSVEDAVTSKQHDPVNSPSHYASGGIECIEAIKASMSHEAFLGYLKGNVQKYMWRYEKKVNPEEDLKKAKWYLSKLIEEQK